MRRDVEFAVEDGTLLRAYLHTPAQVAAPGIVMSHGFSGVKEQVDHYAALFAERGFAVLVHDHPPTHHRTDTRMPMCDAYIPSGALRPEAEKTLIAEVSDILVSHEARRIFELMEDPQEVEDSLARARSISWTFVHRCDTYVAGSVPDAPHYRFIVSIPEGQLDDAFIPAINRDILQSLSRAEAGAWPDIASRIWILTHEIPDGTWGAHGVGLHLNEIINFVSPGWGPAAEARWNDKRAADAAALVALASTAQVSA